LQGKIGGQQARRVDQHAPWGGLAGERVEGHGWVSLGELVSCSAVQLVSRSAGLCVGGYCGMDGDGGQGN
jgi:hypothetical protein